MLPKNRSMCYGSLYPLKGKEILNEAEATRVRADHQEAA